MLLLNDLTCQAIRTGLIFHDSNKNYWHFRSRAVGPDDRSRCCTDGYPRSYFAPDAKDSPAAEVAQTFTQANYDDADALAAFGRSIDAVTSEFENVPATTMDILAAFCPVSPGHDALHLAQNRLREKALAALFVAYRHLHSGLHGQQMI